MKAKPAFAFAPGDVIQTTPFPGYWGCAIVLSAYPKTPDCHPLFHVGITPLVFLHEYEFSELDISNLTILTQQVSATPDVPCIGMYTARTRKDIRVLGSVDAKAVYSKPLPRCIGDGTDGCFPLCGPLRSTIGHVAVHRLQSG